MASQFSAAIQRGGVDVTEKRIQEELNKHPYLRDKSRKEQLLAAGVPDENFRLIQFPNDPSPLIRKDYFLLRTDFEDRPSLSGFALKELEKGNVRYARSELEALQKQGYSVPQDTLVDLKNRERLFEKGLARQDKIMSVGRVGSNLKKQEITRAYASGARQIQDATTRGLIVRKAAGFKDLQGDIAIIETANRKLNLLGKAIDQRVLTGRASQQEIDAYNQASTKVNQRIEELNKKIEQQNLKDLNEVRAQLQFALRQGVLDERDITLKDVGTEFTSIIPEAIEAGEITKSYLSSRPNATLAEKKIASTIGTGVTGLAVLGGGIRSIGTAASYDVQEALKKFGVKEVRFKPGIEKLVLISLLKNAGKEFQVGPVSLGRNPFQYYKIEGNTLVVPRRGIAESVGFTSDAFYLIGGGKTTKNIVKLKGKPINLINNIKQVSKGLKQDLIKLVKDERGELKFRAKKKAPITVKKSAEQLNKNLRLATASEQKAFFDAMKKFEEPKPKSKQPKTTQPKTFYKKFEEPKLTKNTQFVKTKSGQIMALKQVQKLKSKFEFKLLTDSQLRDLIKEQKLKPKFVNRLKDAQLTKQASEAFELLKRGKQKFSGKTKIRTLTKPKPKFKTKSLTETKVKMRTKSRAVQLARQLTRTRTKTLQRLKARQLTRLKAKTLQRLKAKQTQLLKPKQIQLIRTKTRQIQLLKPKQKQLTRTRTKTLQRLKARQLTRIGEVRVTIPRVRLDLPDFIPSQQAIRNVKGRSFFVKVRRRGRLVNVNSKPLTKQAALGLGHRLIENSVARSFVLQGSKKKPVKTRFGKIKFNQYRSPKGRTKLNRASLVEKPLYAINTRGEKQGLSAARISRGFNKSQFNLLNRVFVGKKTRKKR